MPGAVRAFAAALAGDERPDGAWHAEWDTLRTHTTSTGTTIQAYLRFEPAVRPTG
ncbi:hypothetical protein MAHJHV29_49590 [Mycobacterium avium subsp. hominissuis]